MNITSVLEMKHLLCSNFSDLSTYKLTEKYGCEKTYETKVNFNIHNL